MVCGNAHQEPEGWTSEPGKGSHVVFTKAGHPIVVLPNHRGDLAPGTLRSICAAELVDQLPGVSWRRDDRRNFWRTHDERSLCRGVRCRRHGGSGPAIPASFDRSPDAQNSSAPDFHEPRFVLASVDVGGRSVRINVSIIESLVSRLDSLADRSHASRSALLARGARMVLAAEAAE